MSPSCIFRFRKSHGRLPHSLKGHLHREKGNIVTPAERLLFPSMKSERFILITFSEASVLRWYLELCGCWGGGGGEGEAQPVTGHVKEFQTYCQCWNSTRRPTSGYLQGTFHDEIVKRCFISTMSQFYSTFMKNWKTYLLE